MMVENATKKWPPPPRRRIYLMRHGEVDYFDALGKPFKLDTLGLNAEGRLQAQDAARELAKVPLDRVVSSCLARSIAALCTCAPISTRWSALMTKRSMASLPARRFSK